MAHKARRRPSWKKQRSKHFLTKWERQWNYGIYSTLDKILQEEFDREFIAAVRKANNGA